MKKELASLGMDERKIILRLSIPNIILLAAVSLTGLLHQDIYSGATANWLAQSVGQDAVDLVLVVPCLTLASLYAYNGNHFAFFMWGGVVGYVLYTFAIYCFAVEFNLLFLPYCAILGLSFFSLAWFLLQSTYLKPVPPNRKVFKVSGIYFITIAVLFYFLWLADVVPATLANKVPDSIIDAGLLTNPVHVIDLAVFLPLVFIAGIHLLQGNSTTASFLPSFLVFFILMDMTIGALSIIMIQRGLEGTYAVAIVMGLLTVLNVGMTGWCRQV